MYPGLFASWLPSPDRYRLRRRTNETTGTSIPKANMAIWFRDRNGKTQEHTEFRSETQRADEAFTHTTPGSIHTYIPLPCGNLRAAAGPQERLHSLFCGSRAR